MDLQIILVLIWVCEMAACVPCYDVKIAILDPAGIVWMELVDGGDEILEKQRTHIVRDVKVLIQMQQHHPRKQQIVMQQSSVAIELIQFTVGG